MWKIIKEWRERRSHRKLMGLYARLKAVRELAESCAERIPGGLVYELCDLPQRIAEVEATLAELRK